MIAAALAWAKGLFSKGVPSWVWALAGAAVLCLILGLLWSRVEWKAEAKEAQGQADRLLDVNKLHEAVERDLKRFHDALNAALAERETKYRELETCNRAMRLEWERLVRDDQDVAAWAAAPVPAAVRDLLRR